MNQLDLLIDLLINHTRTRDHWLPYRYKEWSGVEDILIETLVTKELKDSIAEFKAIYVSGVYCICGTKIVSDNYALAFHCSDCLGKYSSLDTSFSILCSKHTISKALLYKAVINYLNKLT